MNTTNPIHLNNEILCEINTIDTSYNFLCEICYEYCDDSKKISCKNNKCNKHICEKCFNNWSIKYNKYDCVYCTIPLDISYANLNIDTDIESNLIVNRQENRERNLCYWCCSLLVAPSVVGASYLIGLVYTRCLSDVCIFINIMLGILTFFLITGIKFLCCPKNNDR